MTDFRKVDVIKLTPKWLCTRTHEECTYCKYDAPHLPATPLDWSSEDWDGKEAKAREQHPLLDFNLVEKEIQKTLQDQIQDVSQDLLDNDNKIEKDLTQDLQALTLKEEADKQKSTDAQVTNAEVPENNDKAKEQDKTLVPEYEMTKQELQL